MIWNQFSQLQPTFQLSLPQFKHNQPEILKSVNIFNFECSKLIQKSKHIQKPFAKSKTSKHYDAENKQDEFQELLRKIQKVKQDYEDDHSYSSKFTASTQDEETLSFKRKTRSKPESPQVYKYEGKRMKTMKGLESTFGVDKINEAEQKTSLDIMKLIQKKPFKLNDYLPQFSSNHFRTGSANLPSYNHYELDFTNKQNLTHHNNNFNYLSPSKYQSFQHKKRINVDLNILQKIPVRQSINIDLDDLTYLQRNLQFLALTKKEELKFSDFQMGPSIGSGKFGEVYLCKHKKTNFICALKKILKSTIEEYNMIDQFIRQLKISYMVDHPNVVKTYGHFHDEFHVFILMQYAGDGSVIDQLQNKKSEQFSSNVLFQILNAVDHLHRLKIVHRDIKPQNIVVFFKNTYKLCDFGLSAFVHYDMKHTFCGTPDYVSPEMKDVGEYDLSVDLWSLGVLAYQLIVGEAPFKDKISEWKKSGWKKSSYWAWKVQYPKQVSAIAKTFMQNMLKEKPQQRAKIVSCLRHQFIKMHNKKEQNIIKAAEVSGF